MTALFRHFVFTTQQRVDLILRNKKAHYLLRLPREHRMDPVPVESCIGTGTSVYDHIPSAKRRTHVTITIKNDTHPPSSQGDSPDD
jgi:hypothetical protein